MKKEAIKSAASKLELINIVLHESKLVRADKDPITYPPIVSQQSMLSVSSEEVSYSQDDGDINLFRTFVSLGIRGVNDKEVDEKEPEVFFTIEAIYRVDYMLSESLTNQEAEEFSKFNSVHNVWPFWRQHVFETVRLAELPSLIIPLMHGIDIKKPKKKKPSIRKH